MPPSPVFYLVLFHRKREFIVEVDIETVEVPEVAEGGTAKNVGKSTKSSSEGVKLDRSKTEVGQDGLSKAGYTRTSEDASNARISVRKASEDHPLLKATSDASNGPEKAEPQQQKKAETETPATLTKATKLPAKSAMSPIVPVFKISMSFVKECLYRDQVQRYWCPRSLVSTRALCETEFHARPVVCNTASIV